jgi:serine/threonine-protein kinase
VEDSEAETDIANFADLAPNSSAASRPPSSRRGSRCDGYIGRRLANKYRIESLLGSGSAGAVYKATHVDLRRPVAVKVLHDWNRTSEQFVERFKAEALAASKLDHPNVTRVLDCGQEPDGTLYLVMEYVEGKSLDAVIAEEGKLSPERAVSIVKQIVSALAYAHDHGIIHRDIKPENVILLREKDEDGTTADHAKVCDFGLAKASARDMDDDEDAPELTRAGLLLGSPAYMAPEQIRGEPCDARTDIYCAGVTLFEALTGRLPHEADAMDELFRKKLGEPPCRPSTLVDTEIDPLLEDIVLHALEPSPKMRHTSARQMLTELAEVLTFLRAPASENEVTVSVWPSELPGANDVES